MTKMMMVPRARGPMMVHARARGPMKVRAEVDVNAVLAELQRTFSEFRTQNDARLAELARGRDDVVSREQVDRINDDVSALTTAVTEANTALAALQAGAGSGDAPSAAVQAHSRAFNAWFRRGTEPGNMRDLEVNAALTTQSDPDGGYIVPTEMATTIDRVLETVSAVRGLARVVTVGTDEYKMLVSQGGAASGWVSETGSRPETATPTLSQILIAAGELYANPAITQRMLDDANFDIAAWLADEISMAFADQEGDAFINGDGTNKPRGFLQYTKVANASYAWGKTGFVVTGGASGFAASDPSDALMDLYYALRAPYRNGAAWLMSDAVQGEVRKFKDGQDNYIWAPPSAAGELATIMGKPVAVDDNMPALDSNTFPIAFANWQRAYLITDRTGIRVLRDPLTNKPFVHFYTTKRVGGGITNFEAIKLMKCST